MFLVWWWLTGVLLGWCIQRFWKSDSTALGAVAVNDLHIIRHAIAALLVSILAGDRLRHYSVNNYTGDAAPDSSSAPGRGFTITVLVALLIIAFAAATDHAQLFQWMLVVKSYLVGIRVQALIVGILSGLVIRQYRMRLENFAQRLANAVIGSKENTAWALQGALAVGLIAIGLFVLRPDLLLYLRSFKFGTVEATFSDPGPLPLRDARLNLREFRERAAIIQYSEFREKFISDDSPRGFARRSLTSQNNADLQNETGRIAARIFEGYVDPVLRSILCLDKAHAIRAAIQDHDLGAYAAVWEDLLRKLHDKKIELTPANLAAFLSQLRERSAPFIARVKNLNAACMAPDIEFPPMWKTDFTESIPADQSAANEIFSHYRKAVALLKDRGYDSPAINSLVVFEPYLTGAVSDLIALISGEREKTDFLLNMLDGFPLSDDLITPGIINLYYQVTYSWLNSTGPLPLDLVRSRIEYATRGVDIMMTRSATWLSKNKRAGSADMQGITAKGGPDKKTKDDTEKAERVYDIFLKNLFATLPAEIDIYVQRVLAGEAVPDQHRQSWIKAASRLHAMLQLRLGIPTADIDGLNHVELDERTKERLRGDAEIDADFLLQADLAVALSAILLPGGGHASARNCSIALIYINEATASVQPTIDENKLDRAQELRLRQLIGAVANRIGDSCDWTDSRGDAASARGPTKPAEATAK